MNIVAWKAQTTSFAAVQDGAGVIAIAVFRGADVIENAHVFALATTIATFALHTFESTMHNIATEGTC